MTYKVREVDGEESGEIIRRLNGFFPEIFPPLTDDHLACGHWWLALDNLIPIAFAGMVPFFPFPNIGYLKRAYVLPGHRGHGLQGRFMALREAKAREIGWTHLVSECGAENRASARNFERAGFDQCFPEQPWGPPGSLYWIKAF